jgi:2,5-furandicarboxylate decarboxylase 1
MLDKVETQQAAFSNSTLDYQQFRLRNFVRSLEGTSELDVHEKRVELADIASILDGNPRAVWFKNVGDQGDELVGSVAGSRARLALAFGVEERQLLPEILRRLKNEPQIVRVTSREAPVQQVILEGDRADLIQLPVHLQHGFDGGPYISASIDFAIDPKTGWTNVGFRRLMLRGRRTTGVDVTAPSDLLTLYRGACALGQPLPVSFVVGCHPIDMVAATMRIPVDELGLISSLRGAPLPVVKCVTNDVYVPADAEWVIEGYMDPAGHVEREGPFGEFLGYYGDVKNNPIFHVTAITRRNDALFQTVTISGATMQHTDTGQLETARSEVVVWQALQQAVREPVNVYAPVSTGGMLTARASVRQRSAAEARNAVHVVLGSTLVKNFYIVDPDIDIFSDQEMEWALATRFRPDKDLIVIPQVKCLPLDPSLEGAHVGSKVGFDLTWPFGTADCQEHTIPRPPNVEGAHFDSVQAALEDGPKYFVELMAARKSRDGREIVAEIESLRQRIPIVRDLKGRYTIENRNAGAAS